MAPQARKAASGKAGAGGGARRGAKGGSGAANAPSPDEVTERCFRRALTAFRKEQTALGVSDAAAAQLLAWLRAPLQGDEREREWPTRIFIAAPIEGRALLPLRRALVATTLPGIRAVYLWNAACGDEGALHVAASVRYIPTLRRLELCGVGLTAAGCGAVAAELARSAATHLETLRLDFNALGCAGARALAEGGLAGNRNLKTLSLAFCGVEEEGAAHVARVALHTHSSVRDLNLEGNGLRAGVGALAKSLGLSRSIKRLGLGSNRITADDAAAVASLAHAAAECTSLAELDLAGNALCEDGARALLEALRASPHLMRVRVAPHISAAVFRELCALAAAHRALAEPRGKRRKGGAGKKKGKR